jgi:hypothetical protein
MTVVSSISALQLAHRAAHGGDQRLSAIKLDAISG